MKAPILSSQAQKFIQKANDGKPANFIAPTGQQNTSTTFTEEQRDFIYRMMEATNLHLGNLIYAAMLASKEKDKLDSVLEKNFNFINSKGNGINTRYTYVGTLKQDLKELVKRYKDKGIKLGNKGAILLLLINYAENIKFDLSNIK